ncbi:MAG: IS4 family transposase, partial [Pseudomonadota bacterium]
NFQFLISNIAFSRKTAKDEIRNWIFDIGTAVALKTYEKPALSVKKLLVVVGKTNNNRRYRLMAHINTTMNQILKYIPRHDFESSVRCFNGDKKARHLKCWGQFVSMLYAQLTQRKSLRDLWSSLRSISNHLYHWGTNSFHFSTLARANENKPADIYEDFFQKLYKRILSVPRSHGFRFKNPLYAFDATTVDLCFSLFTWAPFRGQKAGIKLHTLLNLQGNIPECVVIEPANVHEVNVAQNLNLPEGAILIMDRGYEDYSLYQDLHDDKIFFVTRIKRRRSFKIIERRKVNQKQGLTADQTIIFTAFYAKKDCSIPLRRVVFKDPETGKRLVFITNNFKLAPITIANIYKARWQIELFFRWIKQNLKIKSFYGISENAVKTQIWIALIAYLIIFWLKHLSRSTLSMMQITRLLQINLAARKNLADLLNMDFKLSKNTLPKKQLSFGYI